MKLHMLSTVDNPFDPFTEYDQWSAFDAIRGYDTPQYLARTVVTSHDLSDEQQSEAYEEAIDLIVNLNINGKYIKVEAPEGFVA